MVGWRWPNGYHVGLQTTRSWVRVPQSHLAHQLENLSVWATGDDNGTSVHSAVNEYLAIAGENIDGDGNCI